MREVVRVEANEERFVGELGASLDRQLEETKGRVKTVRRKMRTVVLGCGWKARSAGRMTLLQETIEAEGTYSLPDVSDPDVGRDTIITFSRTDRSARPLGKIFGNEAGIHRFIRKHYGTYSPVIRSWRT